tara:strand:+ start:219 stop:590 length:372 start_codon:yes stop_codon:yes gene_type:complete
MAHFAKLGTGDIVERVEVVSNDIATTEQAGIDFLKDFYNDHNATWVQTSYNHNFRKNFAGVGYYYDKDRDAFIAPKIYESWTLDEDTCLWVPPIEYPSNAITDGKSYKWNEVTKSWDEVIKIT